MTKGTSYVTLLSTIKLLRHPLPKCPTIRVIVYSAMDASVALYPLRHHSQKFSKITFFCCRSIGIYFLSHVEAIFSTSVVAMDAWPQRHTTTLSAHSVKCWENCTSQTDLLWEVWKKAPWKHKKTFVWVSAVLHKRKRYFFYSIKASLLRKNVLPLRKMIISVICFPYT